VRRPPLNRGDAEDGADGSSTAPRTPHVPMNYARHRSKKAKSPAGLYRALLHFTSGSNRRGFPLCRWRVSEVPFQS
jgi:hypothetical protein